MRETSYENDYKHGLTGRRIGKRPKVLDEKFDGADIYSVIASLAAEVVELSEPKRDSSSSGSFSKDLLDENLKSIKKC